METKMAELSKRNLFLLTCLTSFVTLSAQFQKNHQEQSLLRNNDGVRMSPTSLFGSRTRPKLLNREFSGVVSGRSWPMDASNKERNGISRNIMGHGSRMPTLKQNQEMYSENPNSRIPNRKQVKRKPKIKLIPLNSIGKNISSTWHNFDRPLHNSGFSNGYIVHENSESKWLSSGNKIGRVFQAPEELKHKQNIHIFRNEISSNPDEISRVRSGAVGLREHKNSPLHVSVPIKDFDEYSEIKKSIPCSCFWSKEKCGCLCNDSLIYDDFQELSKSFRPCLNFSFIIMGGRHFSLPPNLFSQIGNVRNIHMRITNATFDYLFDATPYTSAFRGVTFENSALIELLGVRVRRGWNWTPLEFLNSSTGAGVEIKLEGCGLRRLSSDFGKVADGKVRTASISNSRLEMIGSGAFSNFKELNHFRLPRNRLRSIKRTDLPLEPMNLVEIDLRNNQLQSLEADLFTEMPSLQTVSLAGNPLRVLPEATFSSVIGRASLQGLSDFPLYCDCRLRWLKNSSLIHNDVVLSNLKGMVCRRPPHLRGTPFNALSKEHLMC